MCLKSSRSVPEVDVALSQFVRTFAAENDCRRGVIFDVPRNQIHPHRGSNRCYIKCFEMVNHSV